MPGLLALLNAGQPQVNENGGGNGATQSSQRCPNGAGGARNTSTYPQAHADAGRREHLRAAAAAEQQRRRHQPALRRRRQRRRARIRTISSSCTTAAPPRSTSAAGRCSTRRRPAAAGTSTGSRSAARSRPGEYYLVALASGGADGAALPPANITGPDQHERAPPARSRSSTASTALSGNCPHRRTRTSWTSSATDSADCREGHDHRAGAEQHDRALPSRRRQRPIPIATAATSSTAAPAPRRTAPIVELGPLVLGDRSARERHQRAARRDDRDHLHRAGGRDGAWFDITARQRRAQQRHLRGRRRRRTSSRRTSNFLAWRTVHRHDLQGPGVTTRIPTTAARTPTRCRRTTSWSFTVATGTAPPYPPTCT